jgi:surface polysaccharide O-acyltransferase-like enzyme
MSSTPTPSLRRRSGTAASHAGSLASRDLVVDLVRVSCMFAVVAVHLLMMGISVDQSGIGVGNPLTSLSWFAQGTWFGQVMPLFFVVGGFASLTSWRSLQRKGGDAGDYLRNRVLRLVRPTVALYAFLAIALWSATAAGVPGDLLAVIAPGAGVQLWFLAAYLICQAMVPTMAKLHSVAPYRTIAALAAGAVVVDVLRLGLEHNPWGFDSNPIGLLNMVFVWGLLQQLGFFYADGFFDRIARWKLVLAAVVCYVVMVPLTYSGP